MLRLLHLLCCICTSLLRLQHLLPCCHARQLLSQPRILLLQLAHLGPQLPPLLLQNVYDFAHLQAILDDPAYLLLHVFKYLIQELNLLKLVKATCQLTCDVRWCAHRSLQAHTTMQMAYEHSQIIMFVCRQQAATAVAYIGIVNKLCQKSNLDSLRATSLLPAASTGSQHGSIQVSQ